VTGFLGGVPPGPISGGVRHPLRTKSANMASSTASLRPGVGGMSSATTRSRSVISTVSPLAARRTYSLNLFLRTLRPIALTGTKVPSGSYFVKGKPRIGRHELYCAIAGEQIDLRFADSQHRQYFASVFAQIGSTAFECGQWPLAVGCERNRII
jgi:hypothetical protein